MTVLPMIEARRRFTHLPESFAKPGETEGLTVTRRGKPVMAVLPYELYESMVETLEVLADDSLMRQIKAAAKEIRAGKLVSLDQAAKGLGL